MCEQAAKYRNTCLVKQQPVYILYPQARVVQGLREYLWHLMEKYNEICS